MRRFYLAFQKVNALRSLLSWTHYRILLQVEDEPARTFYMNETAENNWSTRQLERQIQSHYYHRILANQKADKRDTTMPVANENSYYPEAFIKDPYVLEFLNLKPYPDFKERNLEEALLEKLQDFLLELGKGFCFVARQKHISTDRNKHYYIDLVFYNYLLRCFVLIDLKMGSLTAEDVGKMDMYVRFYEDRFKPVGDNPTLGIILCSQSDETVVKYSILNDSKQLFASQYQLVIPQKEVLVSFINREIENIKTENELREKYVHYGKELQNKIS
jgi:predicted nuclease of restriction endonuclease-like (RecB) superfamily